MLYGHHTPEANQVNAQKYRSVQAGGALGIREVIASDQARRGILVLFTAIIFAITILSFRPFSANTATQIADSGDTLNQIGFITLFALSGFVILTQVNLRIIKYIASPIWLVFLALLTLAIMVDYDSAGAMRAAALALISAFVALSIILIPQNLRDFHVMLIIFAAIILGVSYPGILLFPDAALHSANDVEFQHAGLWRGPFQHKNIAGPIFSIIAIMGIYLFRSGHRTIGLLIALLSFFFVLKTGSKTTSGFLPLAIFAVLASRVGNNPKNAVWMILFAFISAALLTVGSVYSDSLRNVTKLVLADTTYTGRDDIWRFGIDNFIERPLFGFGFDGFWQEDPAKNAVLPYYAKWDIRSMVSGHNTYIDAFLAFGIVGAPIILFVVFVLPMVNYIKAYRNPSKRPLADMYMMIIAFTILISLLETFVLRRSDPIWILHIFAVFGLQILARIDDFQFWNYSGERSQNTAHER